MRSRIERSTSCLCLSAIALLAPQGRGQQGFWTEAQPATSPTARAAEALAFEPSSGLFILYGGVSDPSASIVHSDTWAFDGCVWRQLFPAGNPGPRYDMYLAPSPSPGRVVMFGGGVAPYLVDGTTWEYDTQAKHWTNVTPAGPSPAPRQLANLVYDSVRDRTVLFGGTDALGSSFHGDTWEWDGAAWQEVSPAGASPAPRAWHSMTFDATRGRTVLFGGYNGSQLGDTWEWDGVQWTQVFPAHAPPPQSSGAIAHDPWSGSVVLFGGSYGWPLGLDATWEYDGIDWSPVTILGGSPPPQFLQRMEADPIRGGVFLFGAFGDGWVPLSGTWRYRHATLTTDDDSPSPGTTVQLSLHFPGEGGAHYVAAISLSGTCPGLPLPDGRFIPLNPDAATRASLFLPLPQYFHDFQGSLSAAGRAAPALSIPAEPSLSGAVLSVAAWSDSGGAVESISNPLTLVVR
jgi:hypothetical protein